MKKLMCALAVLILTCSTAQAVFKGTLQRDAWVMEFASSSAGTTAITVYYLGRELRVKGIISVPAAATVQHTFPKPGSGVKRIIIEADPPTCDPAACGGSSFGGGTFRIVQGADQFNDVIEDLHDARLVLDFE